MIKKRTVSLDTARFLSCFFSCSTTGAKAAFFFTDSIPFLQLAALAHSDDLAIARLQVELDVGIGLANHKFTSNGSLLILFQFLPIPVIIIAYKSGKRKAVLGDFAL